MGDFGGPYFWAKNAGGNFKKVEKTKKKRQKVFKKGEKRKKGRKIEKKDAKRCTIFRLGAAGALTTPLKRRGGCEKAEVTEGGHKEMLKLVRWLK